jgi:hypothetical protein
MFFPDLTEPMEIPWPPEQVLPMKLMFDPSLIWGRDPEMDDARKKGGNVSELRKKEGMARATYGETVILVVDLAILDGQIGSGNIERVRVVSTASRE